MNSSILGSILSGITGDLPSLKTGKKQNSTDTSDFSSLLRDRLAFDADAITGSTQSNKNFSFTAQRTGGDFNPLLAKRAETEFARSEKPTVEIISGKETENDVRSTETVNKTKKTADERADIRDPKRIEDEKTTEAASKNETDAVDEAAAKKAELEKLLASFSPEDKAALISALQRLSPQDLQTLAESPEDFRQQVLEMVTAMPESDLKNEMMSLLDNPEFMKMLSALAVEGQNNEQNQVSVANTELNDAIAKAVVTTEAKNSENAATAIANASAANANAVNTNAVNANEKALPDEKTDETKVGEVVLAQAEDNDSAKETKNSLKESKGKNDENLKHPDVDVKPGEGESLRQEFKRLHESASTSTSSDDQTSQTNDENGNDNRPMTMQTNQAAAPTEIKSAVEEVAKKFFALLGEKNGQGTSEKAGNHVYTANPESLKKQSIAGNNAGNGSMGNGFSSQSGAATANMAASKPGATAPAANVIFSELLEKAEFLKTKEGSKVLNIELDPKEMGKIQMELTSKDGSVSARISAESTMAKAKLDELAPQIKEQLISQGVNLTEITVDISSKNPDERNENQNFGGKNKSSRISATDKDGAEAIIRKNILPNLRRAALNIQSVDMTV